jgi:protein dithiol:quinone oxidoreductase
MNPFALSPRAQFSALFALCTGLLTYGLYLQHAVGLEPCPMCIMQRYAFVGVALLALIAGLHGPRRRGTIAYGLGITLLAAAGGTVAAQQSLLQHSPPDIAECGPGLEYLVESFGLAEALPMIFRGAGDCAAIDWTFLGLTIANWSLLSFIAVGLFGVLMMARGGRPR